MGRVQARRWVSRTAADVSASGSQDAGGPTVAVIGTGPAALACVRNLAQAAQRGEVLDGARVSWFTSRGKLASQMGPKNQTLCQPGKPFHDYGCQYITASDAAFVSELQRWAKIGACQSLPPDTVGTIDGERGFQPFPGLQCWAGNGGMYPMMTSLIQQAADEYPEVLQHVPGFPHEADKVQSLSKTPSGWKLTTRGGASLGPFDIVVGAFSQHCLTDPFLASGREPCKAMLDCVRRVESNQIIAMQVIFDEPLGVDFTAAHVLGDPDLSFISNNSRKPQQSGRLGTPGPEHWTLLSTAGFAEREFNCNPKGYRRTAEVNMFAALSRLLGLRNLASHYPRIQRINHWEDGLPKTTPPDSRGCLFDVEQSLGWCGDFCVAPCVEGAFSSGTAMAHTIAAWWTGDPAFETSGLLPDPSEAWPLLRGSDGAATVDIGMFPGLARSLASSCTHTDLVPSAVHGYDKDTAHFGAAGKGDRRGSGKGPYVDANARHDKSKGKGKAKGKGYSKAAYRGH